MWLTGWWTDTINGQVTISNAIHFEVNNQQWEHTQRRCKCHAGNMIKFHLLSRWDESTERTRRRGQEDLRIIHYPVYVLINFVKHRTLVRARELKTKSKWSGLPQVLCVLHKFTILLDPEEHHAPIRSSDAVAAPEITISPCSAALIYLPVYK